MKVLCIDASARRGGKTEKGFKSYHFLLKEGETYTVIGINQRQSGYKLLEVSHPVPYCFWAADRFIHTSEIDETEFVREYQKEPA